MKRCEELVGKIVAEFVMYEDAPYGPEIKIEFTDGTIFNSCLKTTRRFRPSCYRKISNEPEPLKDL